MSGIYGYESGNIVGIMPRESGVIVGVPPESGNIVGIETGRILAIESGDWWDNLWGSDNSQDHPETQAAKFDASKVQAVQAPAESSNGTDWAKLIASVTGSVTDMTADIVTAEIEKNKPVGPGGYTQAPPPAPSPTHPPAKGPGMTPWLLAGGAAVLLFVLLRKKE